MMNLGQPKFFFFTGSKISCYRNFLSSPFISLSAYIFPLSTVSQIVWTQTTFVLFPTSNNLPYCLYTNCVCFISYLSTVSPQTVEAIYYCAEMLTQTFKSDLFLNIFHYIALHTSYLILYYRYNANRLNKLVVKDKENHFCFYQTSWYYKLGGRKYETG